MKKIRAEARRKKKEKAMRKTFRQRKENEKEKKAFKQETKITALAKRKKKTLRIY